MSKYMSSELAADTYIFQIKLNDIIACLKFNCILPAQYYQIYPALIIILRWRKCNHYNAFWLISPWKMAAILADDIFKWICVNEKDRFPIEISLKFVSRSPIDNKPVLVPVMAWCRTVHRRIYAAPGGVELIYNTKNRSTVAWYLNVLFHVIKKSVVHHRYCNHSKIMALCILFLSRIIDSPGWV